MLDRPVRDSQLRARIASDVVPVGGVTVTPPRSLTQRQQSPVDVQAVDQGDRQQDDPGDQVPDMGQVAWEEGASQTPSPSTSTSW